jgi:phenylacetate-CoA ligase
MGVYLNLFGKLVLQKHPLYRKYEKEIDASSHMDLDCIRISNNRKLAELIQFSFKHVPYYKDLFRNLGIRPEHIQTQEDLKLLPYLSKEDILANRDRLVSSTLSRFASSRHLSSGTMGVATPIVRDLPSVLREEAFLYQFRHAVGYRHGMRMLVMRGEYSDTGRAELQTVRSGELSFGVLNLSGHIIDSHDAIRIIELIKKFQPIMVYAYPSVAGILAQYCQERGMHLPVRMVFTSSECLSQHMRVLIEEVFCAKVFDWYGQSERVGAIGQCPYGTYHVMEDYSIMEFLETPIGCEMIGTGLYNRVMPLIRYRTNDFFKLGEPTQCPCGRKGRTVTQIYGRDAGYLYSNDNHHYSAFVVSDALIDVQHIVVRQIIQVKPGEIIIRVVSDKLFSQGDAAQIIRIVKKWTSDDMEVYVEQAEHIERTSSGKVKDYLYKPSN